MVHGYATRGCPGDVFLVQCWTIGFFCDVDASSLWWWNLISGEPFERGPPWFVEESSDSAELTHPLGFRRIPVYITSDHDTQQYRIVSWTRAMSRSVIPYAGPEFSAQGKAWLKENRRIFLGFVESIIFLLVLSIARRVTVTRTTSTVNRDFCCIPEYDGKPVRTGECCSVSFTPSPCMYEEKEGVSGKPRTRGQEKSRKIDGVRVEQVSLEGQPHGTPSWAAKCRYGGSTRVLISPSRYLPFRAHDLPELCSTNAKQMRDFPISHAA